MTNNTLPKSNTLIVWIAVISILIAVSTSAAVLVMGPADAAGGQADACSGVCEVALPAEQDIPNTSVEAKFEFVSMSIEAIRECEYNADCVALLMDLSTPQAAEQGVREVWLHARELMRAMPDSDSRIERLIDFNDEVLE